MYENLIRCDTSRYQGLASILSCEISSIFISGKFWQNLQPYFAEWGHKTNAWVCIEYFMLNRLLASLPSTEMECIV